MIPVLLLALMALPTRAQTDTAEFPFSIPVERGAVEFAPGDDVVITALRGNRQHLEPGGRYVLEGSYRLASADEADLAWFSTSKGPSGPTPVNPDQHVVIKLGSGKFQLKKTLTDDGWLHVSFYIHGESRGGIYFGEQGAENTVLKTKSWSDFKKAPSSTPSETGPLLSDPANILIVKYLGHPVPPPADLESKYEPKNLLVGFTNLMTGAGLHVSKVSAEPSEFPFLLFGVLQGKHDFHAIERAVSAGKDYTYGGSVVGTTAKGSTYFALNIIPVAAFPIGQAEVCSRRLMVRLQMWADFAKNWE